ncbi:MAG: ABC transporter permease [Actinobacteria bacterium]|nr:ABC transporter permease [Actinomycetota bacterium]
MAAPPTSEEVTNGAEPPSGDEGATGAAPVTPRPRHARSEGAKAHGLLGPTTIWLTLFLLAPLVIVIWYSVGTRGVINPVQHPGGKLNWSNFSRALDPSFLPIFIRTVAYAAATTVASLILGFPLAYVIARFGGTWKNVLLGLIILPFWTSYLVRMYAWRFILDENGLANTVLGSLGLGRNHQFTNTHWAVVLGLTYGFLPFMVLPLYASLERMDAGLIEAAYDLGSNRFSTFWRITFRTSLPGVVAGVLLTFIPALGDFVTPQLLGGTRTQTFGSTIQDQFGQGQNWPLGSAMAVLLMAFILVGVFVYTSRVGEDVL